MRRLSRAGIRFSLILILSSIFLNSFCVDLYIYSNSNWSNAVWYDAPSGGNVTSAPTAADNVFTNGYVLTVDGNYECNNITVTSNTASAITINDPDELTIHGTLTGPGWVSNDLIGGDGTVIFKKTSDNVLSAWWNSSSFENVIFDPGAGNTVNLDPTGAWCYVSGTGKITIASGTLNMSGTGSNNKLGSTVSGGGTLEIAEGAILTMGGAGSIDAVGNTNTKIGTLNILGTLIQNSGTIAAATFTVGASGLFKPCVSWNFFGATPTTFTCNGTTEYAATGGQNIVAGYYNNLVLSGSGSKQLMGTTNIDEIHYMASSSCVTFNQNSQIVNIPSTGSGISPIAGTYIVSTSRQHDFYDLNDINQNMILRGVGDGGLTFKFIDGEVFNTYSGCPVKFTTSGTIDKPIVLTRTGSVGADNPPIIRAFRNGSDDCAIYVYNSSYYTFDGLSFDIDNTDYDINKLIKFFWNIPGGGTAKHNTIQNCIFDMASNTTLTNPGGEGIRNCILIDPGYSLHPTVVSINYDSTLIQNNVFKNCDKGMYLHGVSAHSKFLRYTRVLNNELINCQSYGIWFTSGISSKIIGNTIHATFNNNPNYGSSSYSAFTGISVKGNSENCYIIKNKIYDIANTNTASQLTGIYVQENDSTFIINNMVYDLHAENATVPLASFLTGSINELGIYTQNTGKYIIEHNTVYLSHDGVADGNKCCAFKSWNIGTYHLNNNIFIADVKPYGNNTYNACKFYFNTGAFPTNDHNLYFAGDSLNANNYIGIQWNSSSSLAGSKQRFYSDFMPYWTAAGKEIHSVTEYSTPFVNTLTGSMDIHLQLDEASLVKGGATTTSLYPIPDDIDGDLRSTTPSIGADEGVRYSKYLQADASWSSPNVWYNAPTGGNITSAPIDLDNVFTNGYVLTVDGDYECNNITTTDKIGAITVDSPNTLSIFGKLAGPGWAGKDMIGGDGTVAFKKTTGTILEDWSMHSIFENVIFDPGADNTVNFATSGMAWCWVSETGKATVASGTLVLNGGGHNVAIGSKPKETGTIEIAEGATLEIQNNAAIGSPEGGDSDAYRMGNLNIYGTLLITTNNKINTTNLYVGENGILNTTKPSFFSIAPDLFLSDGTTIGVDEFFIDRFIQNKVYTTEETINGNKIWAGENVTDTQSSGQVIIDDGANVTIDGASFIILDKGFQTKPGGTFYAK